MVGVVRWPSVIDTAGYRLYRPTLSPVYLILMQASAQWTVDKDFSCNWMDSTLLDTNSPPVAAPVILESQNFTIICNCCCYYDYFLFLPFPQLLQVWQKTYKCATLLYKQNKPISAWLNVRKNNLTSLNQTNDDLVTSTAAQGPSKNVLNTRQSLHMHFPQHEVCDNENQ